MAQTGTAVQLVSSLGLQASTVELPWRDVAELSSSSLLSWRPPLLLEEGPSLNTRVTASGVVALSITQSWIFVSDPCILCGWFGGGFDSPDL